MLLKSTLTQRIYFFEDLESKVQSMCRRDSTASQRYYIYLDDKGSKRGRSIGPKFQVPLRRQDINLVPKKRTLRNSNPEKDTCLGTFLTREKMSHFPYDGGPRHSCFFPQKRLATQSKKKGNQDKWWVVSYSGFVSREKGKVSKFPWNWISVCLLETLSKTSSFLASLWTCVFYQAPVIGAKGSMSHRSPSALSFSLYHGCVFSTQPEILPLCM